MGLALELLILARGLRTGMVRKYPYFYAYMLCVLVVSAWMYASYRTSHALYAKWYWPTQFATLVAGCGVILEILAHGLESYPGAMRFLRYLCVGVFGALFSYVGLIKVLRMVWSISVNSVQAERDLRVVQAVFLATILAVAFYYGINLGQNLKGLILGFGVYVGVSVIVLALRAGLGEGLRPVWGYLQSGSYLFALAVWTWALWSYVPNPVPERIGRIAPDYDALALQTRERLEAIGSQFKGTARP